MKDLKELAEAVASQNLTVTAYVDNDVISFYDADTETELLQLHPHEYQLQSLHLLGIRAEAV